MIKRIWLALLLLLCMILTLIIGFHIRFQKAKNVPLLDNSDVFYKLDEITVISDNLSIYDSKIEYHINHIEWDDEGKKGVAEVNFQAPDLEKIIKECIEEGESEEVIDLINTKLKSDSFDTKEYIISMDVVKENGAEKIVPNDEMIEIMNGSCDGILADLFEEVEGEG